MDFSLRPMVIDDYEAVLALWQSIPGFEYRVITDSRDGIARFLLRNPGLSVLAVRNDAVVGCVLASHDGRRGFLQHVVVGENARGRGIASVMIEHCLQRLREEHLQWVHLNVSVDNPEALAFWKRAGWFERTQLIPLALAL
jgi:ribosomal protein S18 acetylase RimI-like enzyme